MNTTDTASSSLHDADQQIQRIMDKTKFRPYTERCEIHGEYQLNAIKNGTEVWKPMGCELCRKQNQANRLMSESQIPKRFLECSFENFLTRTPDQQKVLEVCQQYAKSFAANRDSGACLLMCGTPGTGKNHLATAIARHLCAVGYSVLFVKASEYLDLYWQQSFAERLVWMRQIASVDLLIIDEVGRSSNAKNAQDALFRLLDARYEAQLPSVITTNLAREEVIEVLGEAAYDRLTQGGSIRLTLNWPTHRSGKATV